MNIQTQASRNADPDSSKIAEESITQSGRRQNQIDQVVEYVKAHPGSTSGEIAAGLGGEWNNVSVSRRLSDAKGIHLKQGDTRKCDVKGSKMVAWLPIGSIGVGQHQAKITGAKTDDEMRAIIKKAPKEFSRQLINHALTIRNMRAKAELAARRG